MDDLAERVAAAAAENELFTAGETLVVGVSGGADSLTLLHVLARLRDRLDMTLVAATLDHGIRGADGAADAAFVREMAAAWGLPVIVGRADVPAIAGRARLGLEEAARQVRYTFLLRVARQVGASAVAVGHNRDDQAETVLMHLIRGTGLSGLRGMLPRARLGAYHLLPDAPLTADPPLDEALADVPPDAATPWLIRPLLAVPRADIDAYARAHDLQPRTDTTNADQTFFRNRLRHDVLPLLETLNPHVRDRLIHTADVVRADAALLDALGEAALRRATRETREDAIVLDLAVWQALDLAEKRRAIRLAAWRLRPALRDVGFEHVEAARRVADRGETGSAATLPGGLMLRVSYDALTIAPEDASLWQAAPVEDAPALPPETEAAFTFRAGESAQHVFGAWRFETFPLPLDSDLVPWHADPLAAALAVDFGTALALRTRWRGARWQPNGMTGRTQKLSDTFINMKVPAAWRDRVPLLTADRRAIVWFVAPTPEGPRGRIGDAFAPRAIEPDRLFGVRWRRVDSAPDSAEIDTGHAVL